MSASNTDAGTGKPITASQAENAAGTAPAKTGDWMENLAEKRQGAAKDEAQTAEPAAKQTAEPEASKDDDSLDGVLPEKQEQAAEQKDAADGDESKDGEQENGDKPLELAFPDGFVRDEEMLGQFQAIAKEAGIKGEAAQKIADLYIAGQKRMADAFARESKSVIDRINKQWITENHADPEFGGENFEAANNYLTKAIRHFVPADELHTKDGRLGFLELIEQANMRNCPQLRRFFVRVGQYLSESGPMASDASEASKPKRDADVIFG